MIFASDLDRTLIYTRKLIDDQDKDILLVERYNDKELSFMRKKAIESLKNIKNKALFIPVTTRTIDQYKRIFIMQNEIKPLYAVVSNGGNILINGEVDTTWQNIIKSAIDKVTNHEIVKQKFLEYFVDKSWIKKMILRDNLFYSVHFEDKSLLKLEHLEEFKKWAEENGWRISLQSTKLYIVPQPVNKWDAVLYIKNREKKSRVVSAGDSYLDYPILINADHAICPSHGELKILIEDKGLEKRHITMTNKIGIAASEEILEMVEKLA
ncbi:HAD family hydrolase [Clostridium sp. JNZ J1-5]